MEVHDDEASSPVCAFCPKHVLPYGHIDRHFAQVREGCLARVPALRGHHLREAAQRVTRWRVTKVQTLQCHARSRRGTCIVCAAHIFRPQMHVLYHKVCHVSVHLHMQQSVKLLIGPAEDKMHVNTTACLVCQDDICAIQTKSAVGITDLSDTRVGSSMPAMVPCLEVVARGKRIQAIEPLTSSAVVLVLPHAHKLIPCSHLEHCQVRVFAEDLQCRETQGSASVCATR